MIYDGKRGTGRGGGVMPVLRYYFACVNQSMLPIYINSIYTGAGESSERSNEAVLFWISESTGQKSRKARLFWLFPEWNANYGVALCSLIIVLQI